MSDERKTTDHQKDPVPVVTPGSSEAQATPEAPQKASKKKKKKKKKKKGLDSSRGVETMFRTSYRTHIDLSGLADNKANIMISINGLMLSIIIAAVVPRIYGEEWLLIPIGVLLITCVTSLTYAILCARPRVPSEDVTLDDVRANRANILFFGNFTRMTKDDYVKGMVELMQQPDRIYYNMTRDIYGLGLVLRKKYRLLRVSYTVFMWGLLLTVLTFLVTAYLRTSSTPVGG